MYNLLRLKFNQLRHIDDNVKMIYLYRYISLIFISIFFLFFSESSSFYIKLVVSICLTVASVILNELYIVVQNSKRSILFLVLLETIGNILLLIPTGGLKSPYIWYAINTVLITLNFLNIKYCIANLSIYIVSSIGLRRFFDKSEVVDLKNYISNNSNVILGLVLVAIIAELLLQTQKELKKKKSTLISVNNELNSLNNRLNESIVQMISLYQAVYALSNEGDKGRIIQLLLSYTQNMMKSGFTFFCELSDSGFGDVLISGSNDITIKKNIINKLEENLEQIKNTNIGVKYQIGEIKVLVKCVKSSYSNFGIIGIKVNENDSNESEQQCNQHLSFMSIIGAMALERINLEKASRRFLINDEQNRIANEIHDSVCQRLFAASCSIQALLCKNKVILPELTWELKSIKESIENANRELRETIYGMSWKKHGMNVFYQDISKYIDEVSRLYSKQAKFIMYGNQDILSHNIKNVLYRVICESVGNAMRHSGCSRVDISLDIKVNNTRLTISDNGEGFDINKKANKSTGLGINNMYSLVNLYNGQINIESFIHKGTVIKIVLPNCRPEKEEAV